MTWQPGQREPPLPGHIASSGDRQWGGPCHSHLPSHWIDMERSVCGPEQRTGKIPDDARSPEEISEHPRVPRGGPRVTIVLAHGAGPCLAGGRHLQAVVGWRPSDAAFTLKTASLYPRPMGNAINRIDG
jgi:hypothetical protein